MFIDLSSTAVSPPHSQVLSHVRQNYHKRCRKERLERLRDFTVVSNGPCGSKLPLPSRSRRSTLPSDSSIEDDSSSTPSKKDAISRRRDVRSQSPQCPLQPIISHEGNSDPFNAYAVKIDPQINEVISFYRDHALPAQYHVPSQDWVSSTSARLDWSICISTLQHSDLASAFIARAATIASVLNPTLRPLAMRHRLRSVQQLRVKLLNNENHGWTESYLLQIIMLQKAETVDKNLEGAAAHATVLQHLFQERQRMYGTIDYTLLQYALWSESQVCTIFMSPFTFDVDHNGWVADTMKPLWTAALKELETISEWRALRDEAEEGLDIGVEGAELRAFFISRRTTLQTWLHFGLKGLAVSPLIMLWLATTATVQQGRMIKHYQYAVHQTSDASHSDDEDCERQQPDLSYWYTQQHLILAEFIWTHHTSYKVEISGVDLFDLRPTLLGKLRAALEHDLQSSKYQHARLWALFVGAHIEWSSSRSRRLRSTIPPHKQTESDQVGDEKHKDQRQCEDQWFQHTFAALARQMNLATWPQVRRIMQGFNHADIIQPLGERLLDEVLACCTK